MPSGSAQRDGAVQQEHQSWTTMAQQAFSGSGIQQDQRRQQPQQQQSSSQPQPANAQPGTAPTLPAIALPNGGGALRSMGEKFSVNPSSGSGSLAIPIATSTSRSPALSTALSLAYSTGGGNGAFGLSWDVSINAAGITRKTDKGIPRYWDSLAASADDDVFIFSGTEDLVPRGKTGADGKAVVDARGEVVVKEEVRGEWAVRRYAPRAEDGFLRVERWMSRAKAGDCWWRTLSRDGIVSVYGRTDEARVFDAEELGGRKRIFSWLLQESYDLKGNVVWYSYKPEDSANVSLDQPCEANRTPESRARKRYIKSIKYGNRTPNVVPATDTTLRAPALPANTWMFEVLFDYGEHDAANPLPGDTAAWPCRADPFSSYRAGFEVRTYRLCRRILLFHHLPHEEFAQGRNDCLVSATVLGYDENPIATKLVKVARTGFALPPGSPVAPGYVSRSLPPVEFEYTPFPSQEQMNELSAKDVDPASLEGLPIGVDGLTYHWLDLDGEGLPGVLTEGSMGGGAWFYKRNTSADSELDPGSQTAIAGFSPTELLATKPNVAIADATFVDVRGGGNQDVVARSPDVWGFWAREVSLRGEVVGWGAFTPFRSFPNINAHDANCRFLDLTGDGLADILLTEECALSWYPALGSEGYGEGQRAPPPLDEERGQRVLFADPEQTIYLADMSGDGLVDIVRVRNGSVVYWPNLGYGIFGAKVTMGNSPVLDYPDAFSQKRVVLTDIDGSGTTDLIYLTERGGACVYFNEAGNAFSGAVRLESVPKINSVAGVAAVDILGNGTSCLVWTSPLPGDARAPMRYLDLTNGTKPHLLNRMRNNLGAESVIQYAPSTKFYLRDKLAGNPWVTRLPFPVQCVESVTMLDHISRARLVTTYAYHHGFFDSAEREFRGFAMVEMRDAEALAALGGGNWSNEDTETAVPPKLTKTWFHTGANVDSTQIGSILAHEFYRGPSKAPQLPNTTFEDLSLLSPDDLREACRSLKGHAFRTELYGADDTSLATTPYLVTEHNFTVTPLQRISPLATQHAVFLVMDRESTFSHHERSRTQDARVLHRLILESDAFGNPTKTATVAYGRTRGQSALTGFAKAQQEDAVVMYEESEWTNNVDEADAWLLPRVARKSTCQVVGLVPRDGSARFSVDEFVEGGFALVKGVPEMSFGSVMDGTTRAKMRVECVRTLYRSNDLSRLLPLGTVESLALDGEFYRLAFPAGLVTGIYTRPPAQAVLASPAAILGGISGEQGGYVDLDGDGNWWVPSGRQFFHESGNVTAADELAEARAHFFLPRRLRNIFAHDSTVTYDTYDLRPASTTDQLGNTVRGTTDYRTLQPRMMEDANGNRTELLFDELGYVACVAVGGKVGRGEGDTLNPSTIRPFLPQEDVDAFLANPSATSASLLDTATQRFVYDYKALPASSASIHREVHAAPGRLRIQISYTDGTGRSVQTKVRVDAGPLLPDGPTVSPRWVGTGWTVFNNKGKPVREFEPFFDDTQAFRFERKVGTSPVLFYDPLDRVAAVWFPDRSWAKTRYGPWEVEAWDRNDTVRVVDPTIDPDVGVYFAALPPADVTPAWGASRLGGAMGPDERTAAVKAGFHGETPTKTHLDVLGRAFLTVAMNRTTYADGTTPADAEQPVETLAKLDVLGNKYEVMDARGYAVARAQFDMVGNVLHRSAAETGGTWLLPDAMGKQLYQWDSQDRQTKHSYDMLRRHVLSYLREGLGAAEVLFERLEYGEELSDGAERNARGRPVRSFDQAGLLATDRYDFKGNLLSTTRQIAATYGTILDHGTATPVAMDPDLPAYTTLTEYDALDRVRRVVTPDSSAIQHAYNDAGLLDNVSSNIHGDAATTTLVSHIQYNAKGEREQIQYGNNVTTTFSYDPATFRLTSLTTIRNRTAFPTDYSLQALRYTYDPVGNVTCINDDAQQTIYFRNTIVEPKSEYTYDATYQLIEATGREHVGQSVGRNPTPPDGTDGFHTRVDHPGDGKAMARYLERYIYDLVGNIQTLSHRGSDTTHPGWTRTYEYALPSLTEPAMGHMSNLLSATSIGSAREGYMYDGRGNMTGMPTVREMGWDWRDQLVSTSRQVVTDGSGTPERTWYCYDAGGKRVRKVVVNQAAAGTTPTRKAQRIYVGGFEVYISYKSDGLAVKEKVETLHIPAGAKDVAMVETQLIPPSTTPANRLIRYQLVNHLSSSVLELLPSAQILTYEEYFPFGATSYLATSTLLVAWAPPKQYRFTLKERDSETGLCYHGARYLAPWLGRWVSGDPLGDIDGPNLYAYARNNPIRFSDPGGTQSAPQLRPDGTPVPTPPKKDPPTDPTFSQLPDPMYRLQIPTGAGRYPGLEPWEVGTKWSPSPKLWGFELEGESRSELVKGTLKFSLQTPADPSKLIYHGEVTVSVSESFVLRLRSSTWMNFGAGVTQDWGKTDVPNKTKIEGNFGAGFMAGGYEVNLSATIARTKTDQKPGPGVNPFSTEASVSASVLLPKDLGLPPTAIALTASTPAVSPFTAPFFPSPAPGGSSSVTLSVVVGFPWEKPKAPVRDADVFNTGLGRQVRKFVEEKVPGGKDAMESEVGDAVKAVTGVTLPKMYQF